MALSMLSLVTLLDPAEKTINCNISSSHACRFISPSLLIGEHTMNHVHIAKPFVDCGGLSCLSDQKYNGWEPTKVAKQKKSVMSTREWKTIASY